MNIKQKHGFLLPFVGETDTNTSQLTSGTVGLYSAQVSLFLALVDKTNQNEQVGRIEKSGLDEEVTQGKHRGNYHRVS